MLRQLLQWELLWVESGLLWLHSQCLRLGLVRLESVRLGPLRMRATINDHQLLLQHKPRAHQVDVMLLLLIAAVAVLSVTA